MTTWQIILQIGSLWGLLSFLYNSSQILRKRPRFKFNFLGSSWQKFDSNGMEFYRESISWVLKNQSLEPNSVSKIHLVVWDNKNNFSVLRHSIGINKVIDKSDGWKEIRLPFLLDPHECKEIEVIEEFPIKWTADESILSQTKKVWEMFYTRKYDYDLLFEDTNENIFDCNGKLCNMEESWLRWTIWNTMHSFKKGKYSEFIKHSFNILKSRIKFTFKKIFLFIGIY